MLNELIKAIRCNLAFLSVIKQIYIFGSVLDSNRIPNDIDILLIYDEYTDDVKYASKHIKNVLESEFDIPMDLVLLSTQEEKEVKFLSRIHWIRLK